MQYLRGKLEKKMSDELIQNLQDQINCLRHEIKRIRKTMMALGMFIVIAYLPHIVCFLGSIIKISKTVSIM